jgi:hypothetical protein
LYDTNNNIYTMAPKETMMMNKALANFSKHDDDDDSCSNGGDDDDDDDGVAEDSGTVSLDLSNSSSSSSMMSNVPDEDSTGNDDEEMGRTRQQNRRLKESNGGRIRNNIRQHVQEGVGGADRQCGRIPCTIKNEASREDNSRPAEGKKNDETAEKNKDDTTSAISEIIYKAWRESHWAFQVVATITACFWTYALMNGNGNDNDVVVQWDAQIVIMVVLVLTGVACPVDMFAPVGVGVFAGAVPRSSVVPTYTALLVLSLVSAVVWRIVAYTRFLAGFGGRMGTTTFLAMNITAVFFLIPFGYMPGGWNSYGQPNWTTGSDHTFDWDTAIVLVCSTTFLSVAGASFRIQAQKATPALHPFLTPCAVALACDLLVAAATPANHRLLASSAYLGFSVGSYVAMAALSNLPHNEADFFVAGLAAGLIGVLIEPFFVEFAGKAGFTAFLGYSTYKYIIMPLGQFLLLRCTDLQQQRQVIAASYIGHFFFVHR